MKKILNRLNTVRDQVEAVGLVVAGLSGFAFVLTFIQPELRAARWPAFFILAVSFPLLVVHEVRQLKREQKRKLERLLSQENTDLTEED